jgi:FdhD protein
MYHRRTASEVVCSTPVADAVRPFTVTRIAAGAAEPVLDRLAVEAPLEVRLNGEPFSVIMRTPGADRDLALGFLFSEGVIGDAADVDRVDALDDAIDIGLAPSRSAVVPALLETRRQVTMNSSCGLCGRRSLASLSVDAPPLAVAWAASASTITGSAATLRAAQRAFEETGGLHAAGLFERDGRLEASAEDVGRHNAVDKLIGRMLLTGRLPLSDTILFVSGRSSFEIVQKAFLAGLPMVAAVSAPSSLAVELADQCGITLLGFVRDGRFNIYTHRQRVG